MSVIALAAVALLGTWRGTSTCVDRDVAPACKDEVVVYDVRPAAKPGTVTLKADKIVDGERETMGELDFTFDDEAKCWRSEFRSARYHSVWCLTVDGTRLTGSLRDVPTGRQVRRVELTRKAE